MSQLHHSGKMTSDLPGGVVSPAAKVNGVVYFVDELLRLRSGEYFIPERFFQGQPSEGGASPSNSPPRSNWCGKEQELYALGWVVEVTEVCGSTASSGFGLTEVRRKVLRSMSQRNSAYLRRNFCIAFSAFLRRRCR